MSTKKLKRQRLSGCDFIMEGHLRVYMGCLNGGFLICFKPELLNHISIVFDSWKSGLIITFYKFLSREIGNVTKR